MLVHSARPSKSWRSVLSRRSSLRGFRAPLVAARPEACRPGERGCEVYLRPHPEERALARVSKDGRESMRCVHPSRRLLRKLLRMRSVFFTGSFAGTTAVLAFTHAPIRPLPLIFRTACRY